MKVYELSRELGVKNKELIKKMSEIDVKVNSHMNSLEDNEVEKVRNYFNNNDDNDEVVKEEKKEVKKEKEVETKNSKIKKQYKPDLNRMICLKNISRGKLVYKSKKYTGYTIEWDAPGDINYIELGEFINLKNTDRRFVTEPWVRILEDDEVEILEYASIFKYYKEVLGINNVSDILKLDFEDFKKKFDNLPKGYKNSVAEQAAKMINSGTLDSIKIKNYIEEQMELDLNILINPNSAKSDNSFEIG